METLIDVQEAYLFKRGWMSVNSYNEIAYKMIVPFLAKLTSGLYGHLF